jgi:hypothetical protein
VTIEKSISDRVNQTVQGDQIGRFFALRVIVYFGQPLKNYRNSPKFWATFLHAGGHQGTQLGRIFAQWAIVYFGQYFENYRSSPHFYAAFSLNVDGE